MSPRCCSSSSTSSSIFLLPWATVVRQLKIFGIVEMGIFIATLLIGLVYIWRKGALRWD